MIAKARLSSNLITELGRGQWNRFAALCAKGYEILNDWNPELLRWAEVHNPHSVRSSPDTGYYKNVSLQYEKST